MASEATMVNSSWLECIGIKNDVFFVEFKANKYHPKVCIRYPGCGVKYYQMALVYASKGRFLHEWLYKLRPYEIIHCPCAEILTAQEDGILMSGSVADP